MALTKAQLVDLNANELIIDLDADTSIHADTDDQIDIDRKSTRLNSSHSQQYRMPSSA